MTSDNSYTKTLVIAAAPEKVFAALTDPGQLTAWWSASQRPAPGGRRRTPHDLRRRGSADSDAPGDPRRAARLSRHQRLNRHRSSAGLARIGRRRLG